MPNQTYITEDFSKETMEIRKNLQEQLRQERQKGKYAFIRNNKIVIRESSDAEKRKREASTSPYNTHTSTHPNDSGNSITRPKVHKTNAFEYMRARSSSLSEKLPQ